MTPHRRSKLLLVIFALGALCAVGALGLGLAGAQEKKSRKKKEAAGEGCATPACHKRVFAGKLVHGPVKEGQCGPCHKPRGAAPKGAHEKGAFALVAGDEPCFSCHKDLAKALKGGAAHKPLAKQGCRKCHTAHSSDGKFLLKHKSIAEQCYSCHQKKKLTFANMHGPVAAGSCTFCHSPHAAKEKNLLTATGKKLCFGCHEPERFKTKFVHKALDKGCESCHHPHGSAHKYFVRKKPTELCGGCHQKIVKLASDAKFKHAPVSKGECARCHDPHGSKTPHLMKQAAVKVCTGCHPKLLKGDKKHGPVEEGDCGACHKPHGGGQTKMLVKAFPEEFYGPFSKKRYEICFECHEANILKDEHTTTLTKFRDGKRNMHYLHVVAPGKNTNKGRSCKACHEVHAGPQANHIREKVPYGSGGWMLPIQYTKTKDGGGCVVGCHAPKTYKRTL
jgi:predicted CXXCH cytochrome family protein